MEIVGALLALIGLAIFVLLPIVSAVFAFVTRQRVGALEQRVEEHRAAIASLEAQLTRLRRDAQEKSPAQAKPAAEPAAAPAPATAPPAPVPHPKPAVPRPPLAARTPASPPPAAPRPPEPRPPQPPAPSFDWESLVGVKLFSALAGIAAVVGAVFFLRYSIQEGWLQPPVRVLIGVIVSIGLLAVCELKAARKYAVTANALDAAAIAILFSTFFAAHALWDPPVIASSLATFVLMGMVTAIAVLLSIWHESLFIAVLGLLGGFATPMLLASDENRPIPLFTYLLLLNVGLSWVAYRNRWPVLTVLTLVFTTLYQWGWVFKFLADTEPSLAMGIFLVFPVVSFAFLTLARQHSAASETDDAMFERTAIAAAVLPLLFAVYFAAVPAFGANATLLFGFLLLIDAGLFAIAMGRGQPLLHLTGAVATLIVMAVWTGFSYQTDARFVVLGFTAAFVMFFLFAPLIANWFGRSLGGDGRTAAVAAPGLLFVPAALATIEPAFASPLPLFASLLALLALCAWRAIASGHGVLYYVASFFAIAAQALWSTTHLTAGRLREAVVIYGAFGIVTLAVPLLARRRDRPLQPAAAGGVLLLASLGLLLYLSNGPVAASALWALAILLAILNAAIFIESASGGLPLVSQAGTLFSWVILGGWWLRAAASVGILPSLAFVTGLTLLSLGGHAWAYSSRLRAAGGSRSEAEAFAGGLYLGLIGHVFLFFVAANSEWSVPPWPMFGALLVITLATSAASLVTRVTMLHAAGVTAAALILAFWTSVGAEMPWTMVGVLASAAVTAFALLWQPIAANAGSRTVAAAAAGVVLAVAELGVVAASAAPGRPPFLLLLAAHVVNLSILLALAWRNAWHAVPIGAAALAWFAAIEWQVGRPLQTEWPSLLILSAALYAVFVAYPLVLGRRAARSRDPWLAAMLASAMAFFGGRAALLAGGFDWMIGVVPVVQAIVTGVLVWTLLRIQPSGERDLGRLAIVAGVALAFVTVAIPLQLEHQWVTLGWALEGAALAWLYRRIPHRGLLLTAAGLFAAVFVRFALNPAVYLYEPRGEMRILNWYLYGYVVAAAAMFAAAWWFSKTDDEVAGGLRASSMLPAGGVVLLFLLLNIEIADYYALGQELVFGFGSSVSQDLTYTIGWLIFGMVLLAAGIYLRRRPARGAAVALIAVTSFKAFLYDLRHLEDLYRVGSFVGLAVSLALVALVLQKYVLAKPPIEGPT